MGTNPCAWCLKERGEEPKPDESHGICLGHLEAMLAELRAQREESGRR
jgi:hypothetical protein